MTAEASAPDEHVLDLQIDAAIAELRKLRSADPAAAPVLRVARLAALTLERHRAATER